MSDDLTERLRDRRVCSPAQNSCRNDYICDLAADRIEELEANINIKADFIDATINQLAASDQRIDELKAKLAKAVGWHPIDTAPTDEAVLICGGDVLYPFVASLNNGEWDAEAQGGILREDIAECPTHWMPLPAPPSQN